MNKLEANFQKGSFGRVMVKQTQPCVGIIGGEGQFGRWFSNRLISDGLEVFISDRSTPLSNQDIIARCDVILVCTPMDVTRNLLESLLDKVRDNQLVVDIVSVKAGLASILESLPCQVLSIHPLFSPVVRNAAGQTVVVSVVNAGAEAAWFVQLLKSWRLVLVELTLQQHDELMAVVQGLTHFISVSVAATLSRLAVSPEQTLEVSSPVYRIQLDLVGRVLSQQMELYRGIALGNPYNLSVLAAFLKVAQELILTIEQGDAERYESLFKEAREHFGATAERCFAESNMLVDVLAATLHSQENTSKV